MTQPPPPPPKKKDIVVEALVDSSVEFLERGSRRDVTLAMRESLGDEAYAKTLVDILQSNPECGAFRAFVHRELQLRSAEMRRIHFE
jgi:hypothetical protein